MSGPIRHIVMWRLRGETPAERSAARVNDVDYACDVVLFSEFTDHAALAAYATHPEHLRVREALGDLRIGRFQVDYPIKETGA
jgi:quinol monooxygenase YgiN